MDIIITVQSGTSEILLNSEANSTANAASLLAILEGYTNLLENFG